MKNLIYEARCLLSSYFLKWALQVLPQKHPRSAALAAAIAKWTEAEIQSLGDELPKQVMIRHSLAFGKLDHVPKDVIAAYIKEGILREVARQQRSGGLLGK